MPPSHYAPYSIEDDPFVVSTHVPPFQFSAYWKLVRPQAFPESFETHGYVCPRCSYIFRMADKDGSPIAGMPEAFYTHVKEYLETGGCSLNPRTTKSKSVAKSAGSSFR